MNTSDFAGREALANKAHEIPQSEYARRLSERRRQVASIRALHQRLWTSVIVAVFAGIVVVWASLSSHLISALWMVLPSVVVLSSIQSLRKNAGRHSRVQRIASFYELGVARLRHQWQGRGIGGTEYLPENHAYASDLDLFGTVQSSPSKPWPTIRLATPCRMSGSLWTSCNAGTARVGRS